MRKKIFWLVLSGCVFTLVLATNVNAQLPDEPLRANIPFNFNIKGLTLPAGKYEITRVTVGGGGLEIANVNKPHDHAMFVTETAERSQRDMRGELVFHRYGNTYFLYEVWTPGVEYGHELPISRQERAMKRELAQNDNGSSQPMNVTMAAY